MEQERRPRGRPPGWRLYPGNESQWHVRYSRARAQAKIKDEVWRLTYEEWVRAWGPHIEAHGRSTNSYALIRLDHRGGWQTGNVICQTRLFQNRYRYLRDQNPDLPIQRVVELTQRSIERDPRPLREQRDREPRD